MTSEEKSKDTKQVILEAANLLFAKHGYGGTSIRDIASAANVNLAAINYHFENKENLYWKVFDFNYDWIRAGIEQLGERTQDTIGLVLETYQFFMSNGTSLMNTFRIFLNEEINTENAHGEFFDQERIGPPGREVFLKKLRQDLGPNVPEQNLYWIVKMTFSLLVHFGVMLNTRIMRERCEVDPHMSPAFIEHYLKHAVMAYLNYAKLNKIDD